MDVRPIRAEDIAAARDFDRRLKQAQANLKFSLPTRLFDEFGAEPRIVEQIAAVDDAGIHGGYSVRNDPFWLNGEIATFHHFGYPVSEGLFESKFASVGLLLQLDIQKRFQYPYAVGGGSLQARVNQLRLRGGWTGAMIPFYFRIENSGRFLRLLPALHSNAFRSKVSSLLAWTGLGAIALSTIGKLRATSAHWAARGIRYEIVPTLEEWADDFDRTATANYSLAAVRNRACVARIAPRSMPGVSRGIVLNKERPIGWFITVDRVANKANHFGNLRVGLIGDFLAAPEQARSVLAAAVRHLQSCDVDLIACNSSHAAWVRGLRSLGFWKGPSNFPILASPTLARRLPDFAACISKFHLTRADGDGLELFVEPQTSVAQAA